MTGVSAVHAEFVCSPSVLFFSGDWTRTKVWAGCMTLRVSVEGKGRGWPKSGGSGEIALLCNFARTNDTLRGYTKRLAKGSKLGSNPEITGNKQSRIRSYTVAIIPSAAVTLSQNFLMASPKRGI